ncbi:MAG: glycosyltransferase family 2 protein [Candidatus Omnitrophica bacterium]|nr:glycosyltransferase family 2 protein [Candidatus Omnitrophota bacterium]MCB9747015.1 glycosyltransferase family 2 protein [Candidatus Omnitrophota bacterium]
MKQRISVIIPAYNAESFILKTINSVLAQTHPADEIIVVDDGSKDTTAEIVKGLNNKKIFVYKIPNGGGANAMNTGFKLSTGDLICFLDHDDIWFKNYLSKQFKALQRYPQAGISVANFVARFHGPQSRMQKSLQRLRYFDQLNFQEPLRLDNMKTLLQQDFVGTFTAAMIRREVLEKVGSFQTNLRICYDYHFWTHCAMETQFIINDEVLFFKRTHGGNACANNIRMNTEHKGVLEELLKHEYVRKHHYKPVIQKEIAWMYYEIANDYFLMKEIKKCYQSYFRALAADVSPANILLFLKKAGMKTIRLLSFGLVSRKRFSGAAARSS